MQFFEYKELRKSIVALSRKGASFAKAAEKADSLIGKVAREDNDPLAGFQKTSHGENRIKNCVKYDLCGRSRLVTVQTNKSCLLLFVGDHNAVDRWLDRKKGISFARDKTNQLVEITSKSTVIGESEPRVENRLRQDEPLVSLLDEDLLDRFLDNTPRKVQRELDRLTSFDESKLYEITAELEPNLAKAIKDAFLSLITGEVKDATRVIELFLGDIQPVEEIDIDSIVVDSEFLKKLSQDSLQYPALLRKFAETSDYKDWMLYMHPDQEAIAFAEFNGAAKLLGVSGSGKTCVLVQRAIFLARKYESEKILVVTLNKPLAALIEILITKLADTELLSRIVVKPFFKICQELLLEFEPKNNKLFEDITWKSGEHIDEIWREFYRCELNFDEASVLHEVHDSLISRSIDAESYTREEFDWIRSAFPVHRRNEYLDVKRQGRTISMNEKYREKMLLGLTSWEKKMRHIGVTDYLNLSTALYAHIDKIKNRYRSILIDESQDFGGIEFEIARRLVNPNPNDLFICGDAAQKVSTKYQNLKSVGINLHSSRSKKITKNYRNSREILELANSVLNENLSLEMLDSDEFEILDPEYASFSGSNPLMLKASFLQDEIASALAYASEHLKETQTACICIAGFTHHEIEVFAKRSNLSFLNSAIDISKERIVFSDLDHTKGFEFDFVFILNCSEGVIPNPNFPQEEHFRELSRLYVAMTRAKLELILSYSDQKSCFFNNASLEFLIEDDWRSHVEVSDISFVEQPVKMADVVHEDEGVFDDVLELTGPAFLYRKEALGLSPSTIKFIRDKVDGFGRIASRGSNKTMKKIAWKNLRGLLDDIENVPRYKLTMHENVFKEIAGIKARLSDE